MLAASICYSAIRNDSSASVLRRKGSFGSWANVWATKFHRDFADGIFCTPLCTPVMMPGSAYELLDHYLSVGISVQQYMSRRRLGKTLKSVERVQTGIRIEKRILKVLKALAEYENITLGDLVEGVVLHAFEGKLAFSPEALRQIKSLKGIYSLDLSAADSHRLKERTRKK